MKPYTRKASVLWLGTRQRGKGAISTPSAVLTKAPYASGNDIKRRGTNPPELIAAAHAGSFSMTLANELAKAGHCPRLDDDPDSSGCDCHSAQGGAVRLYRCGAAGKGELSHLAIA